MNFFIRDELNAPIWNIHHYMMLQAIIKKWTFTRFRHKSVVRMLKPGSYIKVKRIRKETRMKEIHPKKDNQKGAT